MVCIQTVNFNVPIDEWEGYEVHLSSVDKKQLISGEGVLPL